LGEPPHIEEPEYYDIYTEGFVPPAEDPENVEIYTGPNIKPPPPVTPLTDHLEGEVLIALGDNISTDGILPGGNKVLPLRSNIPAISEWTFAYVDKTFPKRAKEKGGGFVVGGDNWGQGSSREHAAIAPMYLGVKAIFAKSFARIHEANLVNFGILPLKFVNPEDHEKLSMGDRLEIDGIRDALETGKEFTVQNTTKNESYKMNHGLSKRKLEVLLAGGLSRYLQKKFGRQ
jgi:aconitate hydratase